ncbi:hypothetical protein CMUS01_09345 [Colletotrichum musicola]|uniref:Uncharacterized protein n=1 Tax=Colletotrichum musicola TaxID=2175873 RepID=A0A8H6K7T7_9PEZI|nr:hypothetical protein CMUS01_09345 [Colletotrichum musicola]
MPKPEPPAFSNYKKKGIPRHTRGSTIEVSQTPDIEEVRSNETARRLQDLIKEDHKEYIQLQSDYNYNIHIYELKLKGMASISNNEQKSAAREEYEKTVKQAATKRITTKAEIENWLEQ